MFTFLSLFRKEDSTLFPWTLPVSVGNLLNFVLANLDPESHLEALINVCAGGAGGAGGGTPATCLARARWLCLDVLEERLREFRHLRRAAHPGGISKEQRRRVEHAKRALLLKLEHVREVHLLLGATDDLARDSAKVIFLTFAVIFQIIFCATNGYFFGLV